MKKIFFVLIWLLPVKAALAQKGLLTLDEHNKYIYYQVVEQPGLPADTLRDRALYFLKTEYPKDKIQQGETSGNFTGIGRFLALSGIEIIKHEDGEIAYTFYIECKDQKYRYWLTDFVFSPYKTDRYGNPAPVPGGDVALENGITRLNEKQVDKYLDESGAFSKQFGDKLKKYMVKASALPTDVKRKVIITKDW